MVLTDVSCAVSLWFTPRMSQWDSAAADRLERVAEDLRAVGVVEQVARLTRATWLANLARYEPEDLGDTPRLLGFQCWENLAQRVHRHYDVRGMSGDVPVQASFVEGALLVRACEVELQLRKAPPSDTLLPAWSTFSHDESAGVHRHAAAVANSNCYRPEASDQDGRPATLPTDGGLWPLGDASALAQVTLVWAGIHDGARTSGWLGFPSIGPVPWFAVTRLWLDEAGQDPGLSRRTSPEGDRGGDSFADRPAPTPVLRPRTRPREGEGA